MRISLKKTVVLSVVGLLVLAMSAPAALCKEMKIGYVDLRRAFYEYEKTQSLEDELTALTEESNEKRNAMIEEITILRDQAEMLEGQKKAEKEQELDTKLTQLQEYDRNTRQELLNKKNEMFRKVIDDIQSIVQDMGEEGDYDYVLDSRNIMYSPDKYDLTDKVLEELNK
jgi:Skp family chaperone for outer membrane proteins